MPRHSHCLYELYVRTMYSIYGILLTIATLAAFAHHDPATLTAVIGIIHNATNGVPIIETPPVEHVIEQIAPCVAFGIIAAIASGIVTNLLLWHHIDIGTVSTGFIHLSVDSLTIALTIATIPKIARYANSSEIYAPVLH